MTLTDQRYTGYLLKSRIVLYAAVTAGLFILIHADSEENIIENKLIQCM